MLPKCLSSVHMTKERLKKLYVLNILTTFRAGVGNVGPVEFSS